MTALTAGQIQAQVSAIRKRIKNGAQSFAILSPEVWNGPDRLQIDGIEHLVMSCVSDLQAREALLRAGEENKPAVLLCALGSDKLGDRPFSVFRLKCLSSRSAPIAPIEDACRKSAFIERQILASRHISRKDSCR